MTIRVGIDGSGPSKAALLWALDRARQLHDSVVLMHVVDDEWGQLGGEYAQLEEADGSRVLDEAADSAAALAPELEVSSRLVHGSTAWSLAEGVTAADLIVVGTHKTGYLRGRVIGTRSIVVASVAQCSVAVVPDIGLSGRRGIVVGVAEGTAWRAAVVAAANEAVRLGQDLAILHAGPDHTAAPTSLDSELLAEASTLAAATAPHATIRSRISRRRPAEALLDASHAASLLVVGTSRRDSRRAGFIGSVVHDVLLNINAPVLIARGLEEPAITMSI